MNLRKFIKITILLIIIILGRVIFLDSDLGISYHLLNVYPFDEGFYNIPAFNLYFHNSLDYKVIPYITNDAGIANLFQTTLTYISLLIFGNNYYGVRMPSVFTSLITILLFYLTLKNIKEKDHKGQNYLILFILIYFVTDFQFLSISRIYVPTIFRIFFITLIIYFFSKLYNKKIEDTFNYKNIILLSFLSSASIFFIYVYNIFIYIATIFTVILVSIINNWKKDIKQIIIDILYILVGTTISIILLSLFLKVSYNKNIYDYINSFISSPQIHDVLSLNKFNLFLIKIKNLMNNFSTNIFRFNISLLFMFLISLPSFIKNAIKTKNIFYIFIINLIAFQFLQTIFENTFYHKRLTLLLPITLIIIFSFIRQLKKENLKISKSYIVLIMLVTLHSFYYGIIIDSKHGGLLTEMVNGYNNSISVAFVALNTFTFLIVFMLFVWKYRGNNINSKLLIFFLIPNIYLAIIYIYISPTYNSKNSMQSMQKTINNKVVIGRNSFSYRFYNNSIPLLNIYRYIGKESLYSQKLNYLIENSSKEIFIIQNAYNEYLHIKNEKKSNFLLELKDVYNTGNGQYISLIKIKRKLKKE